MDDTAQRQELERLELERARAKLTQEQRDQLAQICEVSLRQEGIYAPKHEIALANILYEDRSYHHQRADLHEVVLRADNEARQREAKEQHEAKLADTERSKVAAAEELKRQELQKQEQQKQEAQRREAQESARREPIPNIVQRFNAILAASKEQKAQANEAGIERLAERAAYRPDYARHDSLKDSSLGEISDAKAERLSRMFNKPLGDKGFDPTDSPTHTRSNGRGGR